MQLRSVDKRRLTAILGTAGPAPMARVEEALKIATGLTKV